MSMLENLDRNMVIERYAWIMEPIIFEFDNGETLDILMTNGTEVRIALRQTILQ